MSAATARAYLASHAVSSCVLSALPVLLPLIVLEKFSAGEWASLLALGALVQLFLQPVLARAAGRYGPARVLVAAEALYLANLVLGCVCAWTGTTSLAAWAVYFAAGAAIQALALPAQSALMRQFVRARGGQVDLGMDRVVLVLARLVGPPLAGAWMLAVDPQDAYVGTAAAWLAVWVVHMAVLREIASAGKPAHAADPEPVRGLRAWLRDARAGFLEQWRVRSERWFVCQGLVELFVMVPAGSLALAVAVKSLEWHGAWLAWLLCAGGTGLLAAHCTAEPVREALGTARCEQAGGWLCAAAMLGIAAGLHLSQPVVATVCLLLANYGLAVRVCAGHARRRSVAPVDTGAQLAACQALAAALAGQAGNAVAALVMVKFGPAAWFAAGAGLIALAVTAAPPLPQRRGLATGSATAQFPADS